MALQAVNWAATAPSAFVLASGAFDDTRTVALESARRVGRQVSEWHPWDIRAFALQRTWIDGDDDVAQLKEQNPSQPKRFSEMARAGRAARPATRAKNKWPPPAAWTQLRPAHLRHPRPLVRTTRQALLEAPELLATKLDGGKYAGQPTGPILHKSKQQVVVPISAASVNGLLSLALFTVVAICGCTGTLFIISSFTVMQSLQRRGNCYLVSVALAHLLVSLLVIPSSIVHIMAREQINGRRLCHYQWLAFEFVLLVSQMSFLLVAADNYLGYRSCQKVPTSSEQSVQLENAILATRPTSARNVQLASSERAQLGADRSLATVESIRRSNCFSYQNCCGRLKVLVWLLLVWACTLAYTLHEHELLFGANFCPANTNDQPSGPSNGHPTQVRPAPQSARLARRAGRPSGRVMVRPSGGPGRWANALGEHAKDQLATFVVAPERSTLSQNHYAAEGHLGAARIAPTARWAPTKEPQSVADRRRGRKWATKALAVADLAPAEEEEEQVRLARASPCAPLNNGRACGRDNEMANNYYHYTSNSIYNYSSDPRLAPDKTSPTSGRLTGRSADEGARERRKRATTTTTTTSRSDSYHRNHRMFARLVAAPKQTQLIVASCEPNCDKTSARRPQRLMNNGYANVGRVALGGDGQVRPVRRARSALASAGGRRSAGPSVAPTTSANQSAVPSELPPPVGGSASSSAGYRPTAGRAGRQSPAGRPSRLFWWALFAGIVAPTCASSLLFALAYLCMKEFKLRPYEPVPVAALSSALPALLVPNSPLPPLARQTVYTFPGEPKGSSPAADQSDDTAGSASTRPHAPTNQFHLERPQKRPKQQQQPPLAQTQLLLRRQVGQVLSEPVSAPSVANPQRTRPQVSPLADCSLGAQQAGLAHAHYGLGGAPPALQRDSSFSAPPTATFSSRNFPPTLADEPLGQVPVERLQARRSEDLSAPSDLALGDRQFRRQYEFQRRALHAQSFHYGCTAYGRAQGAHLAPHLRDIQQFSARNRPARMDHLSELWAPSGGQLEAPVSSALASVIRSASTRLSPTQLVPVQPEVRAASLGCYSQAIDEERSTAANDRAHRATLGADDVAPLGAPDAQANIFQPTPANQDPSTPSVASLVDSPSSHSSSCQLPSMSQSHPPPLSPSQTSPTNKVILCVYTDMTDDQLLKSNIIAFVLNVLLWLPFVVLTIVGQYREQLSQELRDTVWWLATLNCCSCSYVYALTNRDFCEAFNKLFYYCCFRSHVTYQQKTPIFRRQLDLDKRGNRRIHLIPGISARANRLAYSGAKQAPISLSASSAAYGGSLALGSSDRQPPAGAPASSSALRFAPMSTGGGFGGPLFGSSRPLLGAPVLSGGTNSSPNAQRLHHQAAASPAGRQYASQL